MAKRIALAMLASCAAVSILPAQQASAGTGDRQAPPAQLPTPASDPLDEGFRNPPTSARPRVWWHWLNGNVTEDGIRKDLEWMKRIGLGGVQTFDANLLTPQIVSKRLPYMSSEWKAAFRVAAETADKLGLELAIAASPGWSETGGPWVKPDNAMKKVAWSTIDVVGQRRFLGKLPSPPETTGPFQDAVVRDALAEAVSGNAGRVDPVLYRDVAVVAYRLDAMYHRLPVPEASLSDGFHIDGRILNDGKYATALELPRGSSEKPTKITYSYAAAQTVRSASLFFPGLVDLFSPPSIAPLLEASDDGTNWRPIASIRLSTSPTTVSFPEVTARHFRLILEPAADRGPLFTPVAGADLSELTGFLTPSASVKLADFQLSAESRINQWETKAAFSVSSNYYELDSGVTAQAGVALDSVIDLTGRMKSDGTLDWTPPKGNWRVVRLGYTLTGKTNHPASPEATGLEVDKLDGEAVRGYLETYLNMYREATGPADFASHGLRAILTDSTEVGSFNWTPQMLEAFQRLRGYDPRPWLPTLTGAIVVSREKSDAFLYDFRQTIAELHASQHYGTVAAFAHAQGLKVYGEALEGGRPSLGDDMDMRRYADVPMSALWTFARDKGPQPAHLADMRGASSIAHILGRGQVAAESMTTALSPWAFAPADLRRVIDLEFANGINLPVIHTSVHVPVEDRKPGLSLLIFGQYFNRNDTWAELARPWIDYIARTSFLLQQGRNVADVAYFYGEDSPTVGLVQNGFFGDIPRRYAYDFVNASVLRDSLEVNDGELTSPGGARYKVLYLSGTSQRMTLQTLRRIAALAEAGATIVGLAPKSSPALGEDTPEYRELVGRLWSGHDVTAIGKGKIIASTDIEAALAQSGVVPAFSCTAAELGRDMLFVHRRLDDGDIFFVNNRKDASVHIEARFRVNGKQPEIWRADTGTSEPASYRIENGITVVPLDFAADESFFVVFRKPAQAESMTLEKSEPQVLQRLDNGWTIAFQPERGAPDSLEQQSVGSLTASSVPGIRYFSGETTYTRTFTLPRTYRRKTPVWLDLGQVGDIAQVRLNGTLVGTAWHAPYRVEIGSTAHAGENRLEVKVANLWVNRLVGDAQPGAKPITFTSMKTYRADAPLRPSGLIGPVTILAGGRP